MSRLADRSGMSDGQLWTLAIAAAALLFVILFGVIPAHRGIDPTRLGIDSGDANSGASSAQDGR